MIKLQTHKIKPVYQSVILIGFIFLLFFLSINILKKSTNTSYPILVIVGKSMEPTLYAGDLVLITNIKINELKINQDIIVYHNPGNYDELIIHRVIERLDDNNQTIIRTQGDNVSTPDRWNLTENYIEGKVIFYADTITQSMQKAINEMNRRRTIQTKYNVTHQIIPESIRKSIQETLVKHEKKPLTTQAESEEDELVLMEDAPKLIKSLEKKMHLAAKNLEFEKAALLRDRVKKLREKDLSIIS